MDKYTFELLDATPENLFRYINGRNANGFEDVDDLKLLSILTKLDERHKLLHIQDKNE